jgi:cardiolipin synthase
MKRKKISKHYSPNNKAQLIRGGKEYFEKILSLIAQAKDTIHLQTYIYEDDETGRLVADALKAAAAKKVKVYLMVDGYASQDLSKKFIGELKDAGVQFRFFQPLLKSENFYFGRRMHHKILVIDAQYAVTGSKNISNRYNDMPGVPAWLDLNVYMEGDAARELCLVCVKTWNGFRMEPGGLRCDDIKTFHFDESERVEMRVRRNDWVRRKNEISATYAEMLRRAESHITILCSYFLPGNVIRKLLSNAAKRGVIIKVIVAGKSDVMLSKNAERWLYDWLLRNNIQVYEYEPAVLHAKSAVCDGNLVTIGSYNINNISAYTSIELNVDIRNKNFAAQVEATLQDIIRNQSVLITTENLKKTKNIFKQFIRWGSYQAIRTMFYLATFYYKRRSL